MRVAVLGAGPTGLTAAHRLALGGADVEVFEAAPQIGGLARSLQLFGRTVDLGSHVFSTADPEVENLWRRLAGNCLVELPLRRGLWTGDRVFPYPLRPVSAAVGLGVRRSVRSGAAAARARLTRWPDAPRSAEDVVVRSYGRPLFEQFFQHYAQKLWGVPATEVDAEFARQLAGEAGASKATFPYPSSGTGTIWAAMAGEITAHAGIVRIATPVTGLRSAAGAIVGVEAGGEVRDFDRVVSTLPASLTARLLPERPAAVTEAALRLRTRSTILVYLLLRGARPLRENWVYVYPPELSIGRLTNFAAWGIRDGKDVVVSLELWCSAGDALWSRPDEQLVAASVAELLRTRLLGEPTVLSSHVERLRATHPTPLRGFGADLDTVGAWVSSHAGLESVGRHARHGVPGIGSCMEMAISTADAVLSTG